MAKRQAAAMVVFNIAWMERYRGEPNDIPVNGGSYPKETRKAGERENFKPDNGAYYGYVRIPKGGRMTLERLGAEAGADYVDDVTVVFTATPEEGGNRVVGWYRKARVWRESQEGRDLHYRARASKRHCRLLKPEDRRFVVSDVVERTGGEFTPGRSRYTDNKEAKAFAKELRKYIEDPDNWRGGPC